MKIYSIILSLKWSNYTKIHLMYHVKFVLVLCEDDYISKNLEMLIIFYKFANYGKNATYQQHGHRIILCSLSFRSCNYESYA